MFLPKFLNHKFLRDKFSADIVVKTKTTSQDMNVNRFLDKSKILEENWTNNH